MSDISVKVQDALFAKLNVPAIVGAGKTTGVFNTLAPESQNLPYVIFQRASNTVVYSFGLTRTAEDDLYFIKCLSDRKSAKPKSPQKFNEEILGLALSELGSELELEGGSRTMAVYRLRDIPEYPEPANDNIIFHNGFYLRVVAE